MGLLSRPDTEGSEEVIAAPGQPPVAGQRTVAEGSGTIVELVDDTFLDRYLGRKRKCEHPGGSMAVVQRTCEYSCSTVSAADLSVHLGSWKV